MKANVQRKEAWLGNISSKLKNENVKFNLFIYSPYSIDGIFCSTLIKYFLSHRLGNAKSILVGVTSFACVDVVLKSIFHKYSKMKNIVFLINYQENLSLIDEVTLKDNDSVIFLLNRYTRSSSTIESNSRILRMGNTVQSDKVRTPPAKHDILDENTSYFKQREDVGNDALYGFPSTFTCLKGIFGDFFQNVEEYPENLVTALLKCASCSSIHELVSGRMSIFTYRVIFTYLERVRTTFKSTLSRIEEFNIPLYRHRSNFFECLRSSEEHMVYHLSSHKPISAINQFSTSYTDDDEDNQKVEDVNELKSSLGEAGISVSDLKVSFDKLAPQTIQKLKSHIFGRRSDVEKVVEEDFEFLEQQRQRLKRYFDGVKGTSYPSFGFSVWREEFGVSDILYAVMSYVSSVWNENVECNYEVVEEVSKNFFMAKAADFQKLKGNIVCEAEDTDRIFVGYSRCLLYSLQLKNPFEERYGFYFANGMERMGDDLEGPFGMDLLGRTCLRLVKRRAPIILTSASSDDDSIILLVYEPLFLVETGLKDIVHQELPKNTRMHVYEGCAVVKLEKTVDVKMFVDRVEEKFRKRLVERSKCSLEEQQHLQKKKSKQPDFSSPTRVRLVKVKKKKKKKKNSPSRNLFETIGKEYREMETEDRIHRSNCMIISNNNNDNNIEQKSSSSSSGQIIGRKRRRRSRGTIDFSSNSERRSSKRRKKR